MALTLQQQLDALQEAIDSGALRVKYADKEIDYRSLDEMHRIRDSLLRRLGQAPVNRVYPTFSKGSR